MFFIFRKEWALIFLCFSCSEQKRSDIVTEETDIAFQIASGSCEQFSQMTSGIVSYAVSEWLIDFTGEQQNIELGSLVELPPHWCECYTYFVSAELKEKFSDEELVEINSDDAKLLMVIEKIFQLHEDDILLCIEQTENETTENYSEFAKKLNEKFNTQ